MTEDKILHTFWGCPVLDRFWNTVGDVLNELTGEVIKENSAIVLLQSGPMNKKCYKWSLAKQPLNAAKACIPLKWKDISTPSEALRLHNVDKVMKMEELTLTPQGPKEAILEDMVCLS